MLVFGNDQNYRGCFHVAKFDASQGRGAQLSLPDDKGTQELLPGDYSDPVLVTGFSYSQAESVGIVKTFGDRVYPYAFGHDPGRSGLRVELTAFLVDRSSFTDIVARINDRYQRARIFKSKSMAKFSVGATSSNVLTGFVVGMQSQTVTAEYNLQGFVIDLMLVTAQGRTGAAAARNSTPTATIPFMLPPSGGVQPRPILI